MKKSKLLTLISTLSITGISLPAISSCSSNQNTNESKPTTKEQHNNAEQNKTQYWTVTFDKGEGSSISGTTKFTIKNDRKFGSITKPEVKKDDAELIGWKDTLTNSEVYDYTKVQTNMNIVPIFKENPKYYTLSLFAGNGHFSDNTKIKQFTVLEGSTIKTALGELSIISDDEDYDYVGEWTTNGTDTYKEADAVTSNLSLYVKYGSPFAPILSEQYKDAIGIKVKSAGTLKLVNNGTNAPNLQIYTTSSGKWTEIGGLSPTEVSLSSGEAVYLKGSNTSGFSTTASLYSRIIITSECNISGSVMGLLNDGGNDTSFDATIIPSTYCFKMLFYESKIKKIKNNFLPAINLKSYCYYMIFKNCTELENCPALPATILSEYCYAQMFEGCSSIQKAPELNSTSIAKCCYQYMFKNCSSISNCPALPATTLAHSCYNGMFNGCSNITSLPSNFLPATTLQTQCYMEMFKGCSSLSEIPANLLPATAMTHYCYHDMFNGCTSLKTVPTLNSTSLYYGCYYGMFEGCTSLETAPALPATTLAIQCYCSMFSGCTSLINPPTILPALSLTTDAYWGMFYGCTSLTKAPLISATNWDGGRCCEVMFAFCKSLKIRENGSGTKICTIPSSIGMEAADEMFKDISSTSSFTGTPTAGNTYYYY